MLRPVMSVISCCLPSRRCCVQTRHHLSLSLSQAFCVLPWTTSLKRGCYLFAFWLHILSDTRLSLPFLLSFFSPHLSPSHYQTWPPSWMTHIQISLPLSIHEIPINHLNQTPLAETLLQTLHPFPWKPQMQVNFFLPFAQIERRKGVCFCEMPQEKSEKGWQGVPSLVTEVS